MHLHINFVMVLVSAVCQWILGALWYGLIFRKSWKKLAAIPEGQKLKDLIFPMITFFVACVLLSFVVAHLVTFTVAGVPLVKPVFTAGARFGVICWVGFIAPPLFAQHIFERRRANLFAINAAYWLLAMALAGGLLAAIR